VTSRNAVLLGIAILVFAGLVAAAVALLPPPESKTTPPAPLPGTSEIDLLAMIDPARDALKGTWTMENGRLVSDNGDDNRLEIPYVPSEEYSFTLEFVQRGERGDVHQILSRDGKPFVYPVARNEGGREQGRVHLSTVEVRKDRVTVHVDNRKVLEWKKGDGQNRPVALPGIGTSGGPTEFRKIRLFEIGGRGRPLWPLGK
jgi:hypothetical protein